MPKICYKEKRFSASSLEVIEQANVILAEYAAKGFDLTLRGLYYKFIARDLFPEDRRWQWVAAKGKWARDPNGTKNAQPNYKWLGSIVSDGRLAGKIDWVCMVDRTRRLQSLSSWSSPGDIIESAAQSYHMDRWADQDHYVEVWVEKESLAGIFEPVCTRWDVPLFCCRGYTSQSEMWRAAARLELKSEARKQDPIILHFGDHDPSGIDMTRDIGERITETFQCGLDIRRLALTMKQVEEHDPPPSPAKITDSRYGMYIGFFGEDSWELEALEPELMQALVEDEVKGLIDEDAWQATEDEETEGKKLLACAAKNWSPIARHVKDSYAWRKS